MRPPCFSKAILYYGTPLPSSGSARAAFPSISGTIRALRLPVPNTGLLICSRPRPSRSSPSSLPCGGELRSGLVPFKPGTAGYSSAGQSQDLPGSWGIRPVPLPRSRIPASSSALAFSARRCSPHFAYSEDTSTTDFSRLNHAASVPAAYASSGALPHPHARLASGRWLTFAGRESNPLDSIEKFPSSTSDFLLSQAYPWRERKSPASIRRRSPEKYS